jgi:hypothetical protein
LPAECPGNSQSKIIGRYVKDLNMPIRSRALKDRRSSSRVVELLNCSFTYGDSSHNAVIVDLSQHGALLSSRFRVPAGDTIEINVPQKYPEKNIILSGKATRGTRVTTDHGIKYRTVIQFTHTPLDLLSLITRLHAKYM